MMVLVRLIDLGVLFLRILGGRAGVGAGIRVLAWVAFASLIALAVLLVGFVAAQLPAFVSAIAGVPRP